MLIEIRQNKQGVIALVYELQLLRNMKTTFQAKHGRVIHQTCLALYVVFMFLNSCS